MKLATIVLALSLMFGAPTMGQSQLYKKADDTTHKISASTITGGGANCSATAIGVHALLTASHCELPTNNIKVDGLENVRLLNIVRDGYDHTIYFVDITFDSYAIVDQTPPHVGDDVFMFGNPAKYEDVMRKGYVCAVRQPHDVLGHLMRELPAVMLFDMNNFHGDSGAGIFNMNGTLIGVVSQVDPLTDKDDDLYAKFTYVLGLHFTPAELEAAVQFHAADKYNAFTQGR